MGIHREQKGLIFAWTERRTPVLRPVIHLNQSSLCNLNSSRHWGGEGSDGKVVSIKKQLIEKVQFILTRDIPPIQLRHIRAIPFLLLRTQKI